MDIKRVWAMPNKRTFTIKPIKKLIEEEIPKGQLVLDPFPFDYKEDALDYLKKSKKAKYALFDPPYSPRQLKECYNGKGRYDTKSKTWSEWKEKLSEKIIEGGKIISFGWSTNGMGKNRGFTITKILIVAHGGMHNDTLCVVEVKNATD